METSSAAALRSADVPRVTVVIATFNRAALLAEAIGSVLRQTYRHFEILVCDDGSTDDTAARVRSFGEPVRHLQLAHTGRPGSPRNRGIEAARGEWVAFLDDDDLWEPEKLARQMEVVEREPDLSLVFTDRRLLFHDGSMSASVCSPTPDRPDRLLDLVLGGHFPFLGTTMVRIKLLRQIDGFDETLVTGEDLDLWLRLASAVRAARVPEALVVVRRRSGSLSDRSGRLAYDNAIRLLQCSLASGDLGFSQRLLCRRTLARMNANLAATLVHSDPHGSLLPALQALRYAPTSRFAWATWARTLHAWTRAA